MSKLYKNLQYDTDYVMQPGDPLTSPDGNNRVQVNDNGTASIITGTQYEFTLTVPEIQGASFRVRIGKSNSTGDGYSKLILSITGIENAVADQYGGAGYSINGEYAGEIAVLMTDADFADVGQPLPDSSKRIPIFGGFYVNFYVRSLGRTSSWCDWSNLSSATEIDEQIISTSGHKHTASDINYGQLAVTYGGTGKASHTINSVLIGGTTTTSALQNVASAKGAFYSNGANIKPQFGTLGVDMGGTGTTSFPQNAIVTGNATSPGAGDLTSVSTAAGALYATGANSKATFGTLPASYGGTGVDGSSQAINKVLASPASGSAGAISFRSLTVADLPTGTTASTVALGNHTHSDYVSKSATSNQTVSSEITMPILTVGSRNSTGTVGAKSVSEGHTNTASGECSHAEGHNSVASEYCAHAEGQTSTASGYVSHAEGQGCTASGYTSHAEGYCNQATGSCSHAEGAGTYAIGDNSHAEGYGSTATWLGARGDASHVEGYNTVAQNKYEHAQGWYNASHKASDTFGNAGNTLSSIGFKVGDGSVPSNAVEVMQDGKVFIYGMGGYNGTNPTGTGVKDLATVASGDHTHNSLRSSTSTTTYATTSINDSGDMYLTTAGGGGAAVLAPAPRANATYTLVKILGQEANIQTQQANKVLAGPSSGSNAGNISFRSLVEADIPTLSTSKISGLGDAATKNIGTASGTVAAGNHTHPEIEECAEAAVKYSLLTTQLSLSTVSAPNDTAEATLVDHAINIVELPASVETVTFTFPTLIQGKARDFMIRLTIVGEVPTIYFQEAGGGSITFDADGETWTSIQPGANLIMFTETKQAQA